MHVGIRCAGVVAGLVTLSATAPAAAAPRPHVLHNGRPRGIVASHFAASRRGFSNLSYHGGPTMHGGNATYAIYWVPAGYSVDSGYGSLINRYFTDVAAATNATTNVYYSDTQYYDTLGGTTNHIADSSHFGGSFLDGDPLPGSGCSDSYTRVCLTDAQLQNELAKVVATHRWPTGGGTEYFLFTAKGIGSCYSTGECSFSQYCAYHSNFTSNGQEVLYANMPYADTVPSACDSGQHPNGDDADATLNVTSHEHNETITDPLGTAWYDVQGNEDGDKCAWTFGTALGGGSGTEYNQVINGDHYFLQREWSNHSSGCVLTGV